MRRCRAPFQFKNKVLHCEFDRGHSGSHFNKEYGCWPNYHGRPKNMDEMINRWLLFGGWLVAAIVLALVTYWLVKR